MLFFLVKLNYEGVWKSHFISQANTILYNKMQYIVNEILSLLSGYLSFIQ